MIKSIKLGNYLLIIINLKYKFTDNKKMIPGTEKHLNCMIDIEKNAKEKPMNFIWHYLSKLMIPN